MQFIYMQMGPVDKFGNIDKSQAIQGTSKDDGHVGWIPVQSAGLDVNDRGRRQEITCSRLVDGTSVTLMKMAMGQPQPMMIIIEVVDFDPQTKRTRLTRQIKL